MADKQETVHALLGELTEIYVITNLVNGKQYGGKANKFLRGGRVHGSHVRFVRHLYEAESGGPGCSYLNNAIRKYGRACFKVETIDTVPACEQDHWECHYIKLYNTYEGQGYNLMAGGSTRVVCPSEETRQLQSNQRRRYEPDLPMYVQSVHHISGKTGYAVYNPKTGKKRAFTSGALTMEKKLQLAMKWKAASAAPDFVVPSNDPKHPPPFIQQRKSHSGLYVLYKVTKPGQNPETIFYKSFKDGSFAQQLKAAKICLYEQIHKGVIKPSKAARTKLGLPGE